MLIEVSNTLTVENPTPEMVLWCKRNLTIPNPEYAKKSRMNLWLGNTPKVLSLYETRGTTLVLPFGTLRLLPKDISDKALFLSEFVSPVEVNYNADVPLYAIHESKEFLQELLEDIIEIANELGITVNTRKTRICKLSEHWRFLQVQYSLTDTGRVIQKINPKRLTALRRKMKKLAPKLTEKEFTDFYKSWFKNHYKIMSKKQRSNMDTLFNQLKEVTKCTLSPLPMAKS